VNEFPELEIFEGSKLCSFILGTFDGTVTCHLRPQTLVASSSSLGPNVFNPLEAYEIDFSGSTVSLRLKEASFNLVRSSVCLQLFVRGVEHNFSLVVGAIRIIAESLFLPKLLSQ